MNKRETIDSRPYHEKAHTGALTRYRIAGTSPEEIFDHLVQMAALVFRMPAAIIAFADENNVHYKASTGLGEKGNNKLYDLACAETIENEGDIYTTNFSNQINIRYASQTYREPNAPYTYYAGIPILTHDGQSIGCLALLDHKTHKLSSKQISVLKVLAASVMDAVEERLRGIQEKERNVSFSKTTQEGMWEWDIYEDKIWWNPVFSNLFNYPQVNATHYNLDYWCSRFDNDISSEVKSTMQAFNLNGEYLFKRADDTPVQTLIRSVMVEDEQGRPVKVIGSILDVSEKYKDKERNRQANEDLMRNNDEVISITSHEIKTPITIIRSYSQLIGKEAKDDGYQNSKFKLYVERIQKQSEKLLNLVENLLDISSIRYGKMNIYPETFDFTKLLEQTIDELDTGNNTHFIERAGDSPLDVYADKFRIGQVLTNLITNAIKYSPGCDKIVITYNKNPRNNTATITVRDFGIGIAKSDHIKLFQKFNRIFNCNDIRMSGTGLGLSIAMEIIKEHGSTITLDSKLNEGSVFSFDLPLTPAFDSHS